MTEANKVNNSILQRLPADELDQVLALAEFVHIDPQEVLVEPNNPILHFDFVETGLHSMLAVVNGKQVETAIVGAEGFVGIPFVLGQHSTTIRIFCQATASGWRLSPQQFEKLLA